MPSRCDSTEAMARACRWRCIPGDVLRIDLAAEPVTGRTWGVRGHAPPQLMELGAAQRVFGGRMSDQGTSSFAWRAIGDGEGELTLVYGTSTSRAANPEKTSRSSSRWRASRWGRRRRIRRRCRR